MHVNQLAKDFPAKHETNGEINVNTVSIRFDCFCSARGRSPIVPVQFTYCTCSIVDGPQIEFIYLVFLFGIFAQKNQNNRLFAELFGGQCV